jgi:hypothetical protein
MVNLEKVSIEPRPGLGIEIEARGVPEVGIIREVFLAGEPFKDAVAGANDPYNGCPKAHHVVPLTEISSVRP